jgi:hypothetical protein
MDASIPQVKQLPVCTAKHHFFATHFGTRSNLFYNEKFPIIKFTIFSKLIRKRE